MVSSETMPIDTAMLNSTYGASGSHQSGAVNETIFFSTSAPAYKVTPIWMNSAPTTAITASTVRGWGP